MATLSSWLEELKAETEHAIHTHNKMTSYSDALVCVIHELEDYSLVIERPGFEAGKAQRELLHIAAVCARAAVQL